MSIDELIRDWSGLAVVTRYDQTTRTWIFIAIHDDTLGLPTGGTRMREYESPQDAQMAIEDFCHCLFTFVIAARVLFLIDKKLRDP